MPSIANHRTETRTVRFVRTSYGWNVKNRVLANTHAHALPLGFNPPTHPPALSLSLRAANSVWETWAQWASEALEENKVTIHNLRQYVHTTIHHQCSPRLIYFCAGFKRLKPHKESGGKTRKNRRSKDDIEHRPSPSDSGEQTFSSLYCLCSHHALRLLWTYIRSVQGIPPRSVRMPRLKKKRQQPKKK